VFFFASQAWISSLETAHGVLKEHSALLTFAAFEHIINVLEKQANSAKDSFSQVCLFTVCSSFILIESES
jgi:hypothetical protein